MKYTLTVSHVVRFRMLECLCYWGFISFMFSYRIIDTKLLDWNI